MLSGTWECKYFFEILVSTLLDIYTQVGLLGRTRWHYWQRARLSMHETYRRPGFDPWVRKIPWRRKWPPTPVFLPGKFHGQRSLGLQSMMQQKVRHNWVYTHTHKVSIFSFLRNLYTVSHRDFTNLGCYQQWKWFPTSLPSLPTLFILHMYVYIVVILTGMRWYLSVVSICISPWLVMLGIFS